MECRVGLRGPSETQLATWSFRTCTAEGSGARVGAWGPGDAACKDAVEKAYDSILLPFLPLEGRMGEDIRDNDADAGMQSGGLRRCDAEDVGFFPAAQTCVCIPRTVHHIWLGGALPERFRAMREVRFEV